MNERRRLVVTGAVGFLGSTVARRAAETGWTVTGIDREPARALAGIDAVSVDLTDRSSLRTALERVGADAVVHCAGLGARARQAPGGFDLYEANARLVWQVLDALPGEVAFVAVSSAAVYGPDAPVPTPESAPLAGTTHYATSKICAEAVCRAYSASGRRVAIARPFNVHGAGEPAGSFTAEVIGQVVGCSESQACTVRVLETESVRDLIDVEDVADALLLMAGDERLSGAFNVCSGRGTSLREYLEVLARVAGVELRVERTRTDLPKTVSIGDRTQLSEYGWVPRRDIEATVTAQLSAARLGAAPAQ